MAKTKDQKKEILDYYSNMLEKSAGTIVIKHDKLDSNQVSEFKKSLNSIDGKFNVIKNTLFALATKNAELPEMEVVKAGSHAVLFAETDIAGAAKLLKTFMADNKEKVSVKGAYIDGQLLTPEQVQDLADMPSLEQSIVIIAGLLTRPISGIANVLQDSVRSIAIIIDLANKDK